MREHACVVLVTAAQDPATWRHRARHRKAAPCARRVLRVQSGTGTRLVRTFSVSSTCVRPAGRGPGGLAVTRGHEGRGPGRDAWPVGVVRDITRHAGRQGSSRASVHNSQEPLDLSLGRARHPYLLPRFTPRRLDFSGSREVSQVVDACIDAAARVSRMVLGSTANIFIGPTVLRNSKLKVIFHAFGITIISRKSAVFTQQPLCKNVIRSFGKRTAVYPEALIKEPRGRENPPNIEGRIVGALV